MDTFLEEGIQSSEQPLSQFIRLAVQKMVQEAIEQEVTDYLGRERYERQAEARGCQGSDSLARVVSQRSTVIGTATNRDESAVPKEKSHWKYHRYAEAAKVIIQNSWSFCAATAMCWSIW